MSRNRTRRRDRCDRQPQSVNMIDRKCARDAYTSPSAQDNRKTFLGRVTDAMRRMAFYMVLFTTLVLGFSDPCVGEHAKVAPVLAVFALVAIFRPRFACAAKIRRLASGRSVTSTDVLGFNAHTFVAFILMSAMAIMPVVWTMIGLTTLFFLPKEYIKRPKVRLNADTRFFGVGSMFGRDDITSALLHDLSVLLVGVYSSRANAPALLAHFTAFFTAQVRTGFLPVLPANFAETFSTLLDKISPNIIIRDNVLNGGITGLIKSKQMKSVVTVIIVAVASMATLVRGDFSSERVMSIYEGYMSTFDSNPVRFGTNIVEAIRITFTAFTNYVHTGEFDWLSSSSDDFVGLQARYEALNARFRNMGDVSGNSPDSTSLLHDVRELEKDVEKIAKVARKLSGFTIRFTRPMMEAFVGQVTTLRIKVESRNTLFGMRRAPFTALVFGPPAIGKTTITSHIVRLFCSVYGYEYKDELIYKPNKSSEYDDGFMSNMHSCILDDVAELRPAAAKGVDPSIGDLIGLVGNFPQMANMAAVDDKATRTKNFDCVVANTNTLDLNVKHYFSQPEAVLRRFPIVITPSVKPEFARGDQLDSRKVAEKQFAIFDDAWTYKVQQVRLVGGKVVYHTLLRNADMKTYFTLLVSLMQDHKRNQDAMVAQTSKLGEARFCAATNIPATLCGCATCAEPEAAALNSTEERGNFLYRFVVFAGIATFVWRYTSTFVEWLCDFIVRAIQFGMRAAINVALRRLYRDLRSDRFFRVCTTITKVLAATAVGYMAYRMLFPKEMAGLHSSAGEVDVDQELNFRPEYPNDHRENTYASLWSAKPIEVSQRSACTLNTDIEVHHRSIMRGVYGALFVNEEGTVGKRANIVHLKDGVFVTTSHCAWHGKVPVRIKAIGEGRDVTMTNVMQPDEFFRQGELIYFRFQGLQCKPVFDLLVSTPVDLSRVLDGHVLTRRMDLESWSSTTHRTDYTVAKRVMTPARTIFGDEAAADQPDIVAMRTPEAGVHAKGDCGSPGVSGTGRGLAITFLHVGETENTNRAYGIPISQEQASVAIGALNTAFLNSCQTAWIDAAETQPALKEGHSLGPLHHMSPLGFIKEPLSIKCEGSIVGPDGARAFRTSHRSEVVDCLTRDFVTERGYGTDHGPPKMNRWAQVNYLLKATVIPVSNIPQPATWQIADAVAHKYMGPIKLSAFGVLTDIEVINGVAESAFISPMDLKKGAGMPYMQKKRKLLKPNDDPDAPKEWTDEVQADIDACEQTLARGERVGFVFNAFFKDEAVRKEKIDKMKTRVICGCPLALQHLTRKYFLTIVAELTRVADWEGAVGINATGPEWGVLATRLNKFGGARIIAGDFEGFDWKTLNNAILKPAFGVFLFMARKSGKYSDFHLRVMTSLATEITHSYLDYFGDLISMYSNPSGQPLTTHINCFAVAIVLRLCWCAHRLGCKISELNPADPRFKQALADFETMCVLEIYGDDHGLATSDPTFTFDVVKKLLEEIGMGYTATDKGSGTHEFEKLDEITFLKRRFVLDGGRWLAPLDLESIKKSLNATRASTLTKKEHVYATLIGHHRELAFHTQEVFDEYTKLFDDIVDEFELSEYFDDSRPVAAGSHFPNRDYYLDICFSEEVAKRSLKAFD